MSTRIPNRNIGWFRFWFSLFCAYPGKLQWCVQQIVSMYKNARNGINNIICSLFSSNVYNQCIQVAECHLEGRECIMVTSGAVAFGWVFRRDFVSGFQWCLLLFVCFVCSFFSFPTENKSSHRSSWCHFRCVKRCHQRIIRARWVFWKCMLEYVKHANEHLTSHLFHFNVMNNLIPLNAIVL